MKQQNAPPKSRRVRRLDSIRLDADDRTYFTEEGYLVDHPILTSVGIFEYRNPDGTVRRELRLPEHVFAEKSLKTYRGKPVIITHCAGKISKDNVDQEQIGTILSDGYQDGGDVRAEIIIHNTDAMKACGLKELSLGYNLDLVEVSGEWNGQPYDAVQTNIVINHLALVSNARAGDQARLNIDGSDSADGPALQGAKIPDPTESGKIMSNAQHLSSGKTAGVDDKKGKGGTSSMSGLNMDGFDMTPEQLVEAINRYRASHGGNGTPAASADAVVQGCSAGGDPAGGAKKVTDPAADPTPVQAPADPATDPAKKDGNDLEPLISAVKQVLAVLEGMEGNADSAGNTGTAGTMPAAGSGSSTGGVPADRSPSSGTPKDSDDGHTDDSGSMSRSLNADSADDLFRQRLGICRIGDQLGMTGLETMTILDGKKAVIAKVLPDMHLDGRDTAYVDAAYDLAVSQATKRKDERHQMSAFEAAASVRSDSMGDNGSMAAKARRDMLDREGGNE